MFHYIYKHKSCLNIIIVAFECIDTSNMIHYSTFPSNWMICLNTLTRRLFLNIFPQNVMPWHLNNWYIPYFFHQKAVSLPNIFSDHFDIYQWIIESKLNNLKQFEFSFKKSVMLWPRYRFDLNYPGEGHVARLEKCLSASHSGIKVYQALVPCSSFECLNHGILSDNHMKCRLCI